MCHEKSKAIHKGTNETNAANDDNDDNDMKIKRLKDERGQGERIVDMGQKKKRKKKKRWGKEKKKTYIGEQEEGNEKRVEM